MSMSDLDGTKERKRVQEAGRRSDQLQMEGHLQRRAVSVGFCKRGQGCWSPWRAGAWELLSLPVSREPGEGLQPSANDMAERALPHIFLPESGNVHSPLLPNCSQPKAFSSLNKTKPSFKPLCKYNLL